MPDANSWLRISIDRIEDLADAVYGAGLEATQMSAGLLSGSLAFAQSRGVIYGTGHIGGTIALNGPLSSDKITFGLGLDVRPGTWHWMVERHTGDIGVFHPGDEHDSRYTPGSLYATLSIDADQLEEEAAHEELVLDRKTLGGTGFHSRRISADHVSRLRPKFERIHRGYPADMRAGETLLRTVIEHFARPPFSCSLTSAHNTHAKAVDRARSYIREHLEEPISIDAVAAAARTSRRTLFRAFADILDDTPQTYTRRLRLHRIRHNLANDAEKASTIALIANQWGVTDQGRMASRYRELFGERPSETLARARRSLTLGKIGTNYVDASVAPVTIPASRTYRRESESSMILATVK